MSVEGKRTGDGWTVQDRFFSEEELYDFVSKAAFAKHLAQTEKALPLAKRLHEGQVRKGDAGVPYINHPLTVACHALALGILDDEVVAAALLHDVAEDCGVEPDELPVSAETRRAVSLLTFREREGETKEAAKKRYYRAISENRIASLVKVLDRCHNISSMAGAFSGERMALYIDETEDFIMPLLGCIRQRYPAYGHAVFLLEYHMRSVLDTQKRLL